MSIINKIKNSKKDKSILYTTPSHNQGRFMIPYYDKILGRTFLNSDFSEIDGFDNLRNPTSIIKDVLDEISGIYSSKASFMLTNGSTSGIIVAMLTCVKPNDKVLIARNCHISVYNALVLCGCTPIWFNPNYDKDWGLYTDVNPNQIKNILLKHSDIKAVFVTSPTYEGIFSNIKEISIICKKHNAVLVVDEAHGALLNFGNFKEQQAINCGADISIQSLHKTAGAPNPTALLHIGPCSNITQQTVQKALNTINTTSPSYPLLASIEACVKYLNSDKGKKHVNKIIENADYFATSLDNSYKIFSKNNDKTKIVLKKNNVNALELAKFLNNQFNIEEEFSTANYLLFITGIGTDKNKLKKLSTALKQLSNMIFTNRIDTINSEYTIPQFAITPKEAFYSETSACNVTESIGKISAETIIDYPPGIPILVAGEIISEEILPFIKQEKIQVCI